jgi:hypothetical protein
VSNSGTALDRLYLVDLPGYGYARGGEASAAEFEALTSRTSAAARRARRHGDGAGALGGRAAWSTRATRASRPTSTPVAGCRGASIGRRRRGAKIDKLSRAERSARLRAWRKALNVPVLPVSAVTGEGLDQLWTLISSCWQRPSPTSGSPRAATTSR